MNQRTLSTITTTVRYPFEYAATIVVLIALEFIALLAADHYSSGSVDDVRSFSKLNALIAACVVSWRFASTQQRHMTDSEYVSILLRSWLLGLVIEAAVLCVLVLVIGVSEIVPDIGFSLWLFSFAIVSLVQLAYLWFGMRILGRWLMSRVVGPRPPAT